MGHKIVMEADGQGNTTQDAMQAIDIGGYREVALLVTVTTNGDVDDELTFETANEPFDSSFAEATITSIDDPGENYVELNRGSTEPVTTLAYCTEFARYLRWNASGASSAARFTIDALVKKAD